MEGLTKVYLNDCLAAITDAIFLFLTENDPALALQIGICFVSSYKSPFIMLSPFHQDELDAEADAEGEADADLIVLDAAPASPSV